MIFVFVFCIWINYAINHNWHGVALRVKLLHQGHAPNLSQSPCIFWTFCILSLVCKFFILYLDQWCIILWSGSQTASPGHARKLVPMTLFFGHFAFYIWTAIYFFFFCTWINDAPYMTATEPSESNCCTGGTLQSMWQSPNFWRYFIFCFFGLLPILYFIFISKLAPMTLYLYFSIRIFCIMYLEYGPVMHEIVTTTWGSNGCTGGHTRKQDIVAFNVRKNLCLVRQCDML